MRIAFAINQLALGGAERQLVDVAKAMAQRGHECTVITFYGKEVLRPELEASGIRTINLQAGRTYWRGILPLARAIRRLRVDVLNTHLPEPGVCGRMAGLLTGVPVVSTEQNLLTSYKSYIRFANELTLNSAHTIICISQAVKRSMHRRTNWYLLPKRNVRVIYNSVDIRRLLAQTEDRESKRSEFGLNPHDFVLVNVGRYHKQKGQTYLLRAMPAILREEPNARLLLVGWGPLEESLRYEAMSLGVGESVLFARERSDAVALMAAGDVFVFPSLWEGLGIALLEAMAVGTPVVTTDCPPLTEVVRDGVHGLLTPSANADAIAGAVLRLRSDSRLRERCVRAAKQRVLTQFTVEAAAAQYEEVFRASLAGNGRRLPK